MRWSKTPPAHLFRRDRRSTTSAARRRTSLRLGVEPLEARLVLAATAPFNMDGLPWVIASRGPTVVEAENFDYGGEGVAYHSGYARNPAGVYRPNEGVGVEGPSASAGGTYNLGYFNAGNWTNYTIDVAQAGTYQVTLRAATAQANGATARVTFGAGGASPAATFASTGDLAVPASGGWGNYRDLAATVTLPAGRQVMTLWDVAGGFNSDVITISPAADAGGPEQPYTPSGTGPGSTLRGTPTVLPAFGAARIESENYDLGGQAAGPDGVQAAGYYWLNAQQNPGTYPYTNTPFRPGEQVDLANRGTGLATTNWKGGAWLQYTVLAAGSGAPLDPAATQPSPQAIRPTPQYQVLVSYANAGTQISRFTISSTYTDPATGITSVTPVGNLTLPPTGGIYNYATATAQITLTGLGPNTLRFADADAPGANSNVDIDYFRLINARTTGNAGLAWDLPASGAATRIPAANYDAAPGGAAVAAGPAIAPTADPAGGGTDVRGLSAGDSLTYTVMANLTARYQLGLRVRNAGGTPAQVRVTFDAGAGFGTLGPNNQAPDPIAFVFDVPAGPGYQTVTTATNVSALPQTTSPWVQIPYGPQTMRVQVVSGSVDFHYADLAALIATPASKPDANQLGSYAAEPPAGALNAVGDLFSVAYNTQYDWINPPANAAVPTNDWWTNLLVSTFTGDMYAYPQKINDGPNGVAVSDFSGVGTDASGGNIRATGQQSLLVGAAGATFTRDALLDYGDWTVHYRMEAAGGGSVDVTAGRGLPYTWFEFNGLASPTLTMQAGGDATQTPYTAYDAAGNALGASFTADHFRLDTGGLSFGVFAPAGTTFTRSGSTYAVKFAPGARPYLVTAVLPDGSNGTLDTYFQHAYAVPRQVGGTPSSTFAWDPYDASAGRIVTRWSLNTVAIDPAAPAGTLAARGDLSTLQGFLPMYTSDGASGLSLLAGPTGQTLRYPSINGNIAVAAGTRFAVSQIAAGVNFAMALPQAINAPEFTFDPANPAASTVSTDYDPQAMRAFLQAYIRQHTNAAATDAAGKTILNYGDDTYWGAKPLQEYAEYALIARQTGDTASFNVLLDNLRTALTDWFTYDPNRDTTSHYFAYYPGSHALIGFSPAYGSESFTDNHFHYGYFTAAAGVLALLDPAWAQQYGAMAKMVAMQYANWLHSGDAAAADLPPDVAGLPFLRTFEPWVGHSYAGGTGSGTGNNQESTSEAMQSWLGLILLGQALNDPQMTSAGMMGYTLESKSTLQQWFNVDPASADADGTGLPGGYGGASGPYSNVGINFDGGKGYGTYFGDNPEYILGIQALPIWPSLDFLGKDSATAAAAVRAMLAARQVYYNQADHNSSYDPAHPGTYNTFASFDAPGGFGGVDWLNIALGYQANYDPQATANEYARILAQQTAASREGTTGLYYYIGHSYQTYGIRDWGYHLSVPLGGVYSHGADGTTLANTRTYMAFNPGTSPAEVLVYDASGVVVDRFTAQPGFNSITRSTAGNHAPPVIATGPSGSPATVTGTSTTLGVSARNEQGDEGGLSYAWELVAGPAGATPTFSANGSGAAKSTVVTFTSTGSYLFRVTVTDANGLKASSTVAVTVVPTLGKLVIAPGTASLFTGANLAFTVIGTDQFGATIAKPAVAWSVAGGGSISDAGVYQAPGTPGSAVITASGGSATVSANVAVLNRLPAPTGLAALVAGDFTFVDLSWAAPAGGATGYNVYRGTATGAESATPINAAPIAGTGYRDTAVAPGVTYYYYVIAVNAGGASPASPEAAATTAPDLARTATRVVVSSTENGGTLAAYATDGKSNTRWSSAASDPQWIYVDLGATYTITQVRLNWEAAAGKDYLIQVSDDGESWRLATDPVVGNATAGWHSYAGLSATGRYVRVYGTARLTQYGYSLFDFNVYGTRAAAAPTGLAASSGDPYGVDLAWVAPPGAVTGYNIYRGTAAGAESATPINAAPVVGTTFHDGTVVPGVTYFYYVVAINGSGPGNPSAEASATTPAVAGADLARGRSVTTSSDENAAFAGGNATDGRGGTRWSSQFRDGQWISVDLGATYNLREVRLNWEAAAGKDYLIQVSDDGESWRLATDPIVGNATAGWHSYAGLSATGRYVRVYGSARLTQYGYSLYDFEVYGAGVAAGTTPLDRSSWVASSSSTEGGGSAANAIDGSASSRWSSGQSQAAGQWFKLDLGSAQTFRRLAFDAGSSTNDYARGYQVLVSDDGSDWTSLPAVAAGSGSGPLVSVDLGKPVRARYVRIVLTGSDPYWWSIADLNLIV